MLKNLLLRDIMEANTQSSECSSAVCQESVDLQEVLRPTLRRLGVLSLVCAYCWALPAIVLHYPPHWPGLIAPVILALGASLSLHASHRYSCSAAILCLALAFASLSEAGLGHVDTAGSLVFLMEIIVGLLAGPVYAARAAIAACLAYLFLPLVPAVRNAGIRGSLAGVGLVWAVGGSVFAALRRAEESERHAWVLAREAMQRRAEWQRTSEALRNMYALLERTNYELEVARREAEEARQAKARFAAMVSHELRTPLNVILGFSRVMYQTPEVYGQFFWPRELRLDMHAIYRASRHLLSMIDDILDLSRIEARRLTLKLEPTNLVPLVEEVAATARGLLRGSDVSLYVQLPDSVPEVIVDPGRIRQVLFNLLNNAIRFTNSGQIVIAVRMVEGEVEIAVSDTGAGIPERELPHVFDEFSQAHSPMESGRGSAGLGLAICKEIVELHGGRIIAESRIGEGSTFRFTIPLPASGKARSRLAYYAPAGWSPPLPANRLGPSVIVLGQDEASVRAVTRGIDGYRVLPVIGTESRGSLADIVEAEHPAGIVVVKDPFEGPSAITPERIWELTGRSDLGVVECEIPNISLIQRELQVHGYLTKPVDPEELLAAVKCGDCHIEDILVVDDDPGFRTMVERVLRSAFPCVHLHLCADAEEALAVLMHRKCNLVLLDLAMPGMGGVCFLRKARELELLRDIRIIVITGIDLASESVSLFPTRLHFRKKVPLGAKVWSRCIKALLDSAPPDYSRPATGAV
jgi:signal transduction histidine kinase/CheY-like chemotaxis protein